MVPCRGTIAISQVDPSISRAEATRIIQNAGQEWRPIRRLRIRSDLVLTNALITEAHGAVVTDLNAAQFYLFDGGKETIIKYCTSEDDSDSIRASSSVRAVVWGNGSVPSMARGPIHPYKR